MEKYVRDKRSPIPSNQHVSKVMSANKAKDTKPEIELRKLLWNNGIRGYRINKKGIPGTPDITISKKRLAIFLNGCFWHRCPHCDLPLPKSNKEFWEKKFETNKKRDLKKCKELQELGWHPLIIWECQLNDDRDNILLQVNKWLD